MPISVSEVFSFISLQNIILLLTYGFSWLFLFLLQPKRHIFKIFYLPYLWGQWMQMPISVSEVYWFLLFLYKSILLLTLKKCFLLTCCTGYGLLQCPWMPISISEVFLVSFVSLQKYMAADFLKKLLTYLLHRL